MRRSLAVVTVILLASTWLAAVPLRAASAFASPAFQAQWQAAEAVAPNFWGPLATARDGQQEPYKEAPSGGQRLVQYFDKARMELTVPALSTVTTGLLTVELKTGKMQIGDTAFEQRQPAKINLAGDPGESGPTYADLSQLAERVPRPSGGIGLFPPTYIGNGRFKGYDERVDHLPFDLVPKTGDYVSYVDDPSGHYGTFVYQPFLDFIHSMPLPIEQTTGYPIGLFFFAQVKIGGAPTWVLVQPFERRVLTYNPNNPAATRVEFGNIGQHYYTWRYGANPSPQAATPPTNISADFTPFAKRWGAHGVGFVVNADGNAHLDWRTYITCSAKNPDHIPCEEPYTSYAGHATIQFVSVDGDAASGNVLTSNDPRFQPANVVVRLVLKPYDMVELREPTGQTYTFCGPDYPKLAPREVRDTYPCGA